MRRNKKQPAWFRLQLCHKPVMDAVSAEAVGRAFKAAYQYFATGEAPKLDALAGAVFALLRVDADQAKSDYDRSVEAGKAGADKRWYKEDEEPICEEGASMDTQQEDSTPMGTLPCPMGADAEDRREKKEEYNNTCSPAGRFLTVLSGSSFRETRGSARNWIHTRQGPWAPLGASP